MKIVFKRNLDQIMAKGTVELLLIIAISFLIGEFAWEVNSGNSLSYWFVLSTFFFMNYEYI